MRLSPGDRRFAATLIAFGLTVYSLKHEVNRGLGVGCDTNKETLLRGGAEEEGDAWEVAELPIMRSKSRGFRPVYVYSKAEPEVRPFYSQEGQDKLIQELMKANDEKEGGEASKPEGEKRPPFFVDLAANDALVLSNSFQLERDGWDGVCIEPNPRYWYRLAAFRTCTIVGSFVGGSQAEDGREVDVNLSNARKGGIVGQEMDNRGGAEEKRNLVSLRTVFERTNVPAVIDYFSLDVEGAEHLVMRDFPWERYSFRFLTIERPNDDLKILLQLHGYRLARTISSYDETLWVSEENVGLSEEEIDTICDRVGIKKY